MAVRELFSKGFPTNRIPIKVPSTGQNIILRETTVIELKSMCKTVIDNFGRKQMDVIYDAATAYLQSMIMTDGVDVAHDFTEFDRLYCLMVFFQLSFYKEPMNFKCPNCGVDIVYRYDMSRFLSKMDSAFVSDQEESIPYRSKIYDFVLGWPSVASMSMMMHYSYTELGEVTEEMERTQLGINLVLSFIKKLSVKDAFTKEVVVELDLTDPSMTFQDRLACLNELPSIVTFDERNGVFSKVTGYFLNRLENCFGFEICPQCHKQTDFGLPQSSMFYSLFYGSLNSIYGYILKVECLLLYRYDCCIFDKEQHMTYNDLNILMHQLGATMEKENEERKNITRDNLGKGLYLIREILNTYVFPEDKRRN